jgi:hypothetical protein
MIRDDRKNKFQMKSIWNLFFLSSLIILSTVHGSSDNITIDTLEGTWNTGEGISFNVKKSESKIVVEIYGGNLDGKRVGEIIHGDGDNFQLVPDDSRDYIRILEKNSTKNKLRWKHSNSDHIFEWTRINDDVKNKLTDELKAENEKLTEQLKNTEIKLTTANDEKNKLKHFVFEWGQVESRAPIFEQ